MSPSSADFLPLRVVFFGTPQFAVPCFKALLADERFQVLGCVSQPDKRRGRGSKTMPSAIKQVALENEIPLWQPARIKKDTETLTQLEALGADVFVVVAYGQILSKQILDMPRLGCVNVHGSLLPQYRGAAPIQWCIVQGQNETGVTTMQMDEGMDTGDMLQVARLPIGPMDNAQDVAQRMAALGAETLVETLVRLGVGAAIATPQDNEQATYAPLIQKSDYELDWSKSAWALHNQVRGFHPNCTSSFRDTAIKLLETLPLDQLDQPGWPEEVQTDLHDWLQKAEGMTAETAGVAPGCVIACLKNWGPVVQTGEGPLLLKQVKPAGKKAMSGWDFVNGLRIELGEQLGA